MNTFSERLNKAMEMKGMTAIALAEATGLSKSRISHYVNGRYTPKSAALLQIANALGVSEHWLMDSSEPTSQQLSEWDLNANQIMEESQLWDKIEQRFGAPTVQVVHNMDEMNANGQETVAKLVEDLSEVPYYKKGE